MSQVFLDNITYADLAAMFPPWTGSSGTAVLESTTPVPGNTLTQYLKNGLFGANRPFTGNYTQGTMGFSLRPSAANGSCGIFRDSSANNQVAIGIAGGVASANRMGLQSGAYGGGGTLFIDAVMAATIANTWFYVELSFVVSTTVGKLHLKIWDDANSLLSDNEVTAINTDPNATGSWARWTCSSDMANCKYDNFYFTDTYGEFLGPGEHLSTNYTDDFDSASLSMAGQGVHQARSEELATALLALTGMEMGSDRRNTFSSGSLSLAGSLFHQAYGQRLAPAVLPLTGGDLEDNPHDRFQTGHLTLTGGTLSDFYPIRMLLTWSTPILAGDEQLLVYSVAPRSQSNPSVGPRSWKLIYISPLAQPSGVDLFDSYTAAFPRALAAQVVPIKLVVANTAGFHSAPAFTSAIAS